MTTARTRLAAAVGVAATTAMAAAALGASPAHAEGIVFGADAPNAIDGQYIVSLNDTSTLSVAGDLFADYDGVVTNSYKSINGFSVEMSADEARALAANPAVAYVQQNLQYHITGSQANPPSWGQDQVDGTTDSTYDYPDSAGSGVTAFVIDTGVDYANSDFGGRASSGYDAVDHDGDAMDEHGHGTHVAGTIAGDLYGLAKDADIVAVRVLDANGSGTTEGVVEGIDWVTQNHSGPSVANMSLGGGKDQALDDAVAASIASGVTYGVAAGNDYGADACMSSPAASPDAITVAASDNTDALASFSNIGTCVDIIAPGVDIVSDAPGGGSATMSGTSMATPHVVGAAALYLGENPSATPADVRDALVDNAEHGAVSNPGTGSPNELLSTAFLLGDGGEDPGDPGDPGDPDPEPGDCEGSNDTAQQLSDHGTTVSSIEISCDGVGSSEALLTLDITHTWRGDLEILLIAPDGTAYLVKNADISDSGDDVVGTFVGDLSDVAAGGTWTLQVTDMYYGDTGTLNSWSLTV